MIAPVDAPASTDTCGDLVLRGAGELRPAGIDKPLLESQVLLAWAIGGSRLDILAHPERRVDSVEVDRFLAGIARRRNHEPLAYIRGTQEFYGLEFAVTPDVLIPRPETELLVDFALEAAEGLREPIIWDVCTGSGCVAVACAMRIPSVRVIASDISPAALEVAAKNASNHSVRIRVAVVHSDLLSAALRESVTIILANPPYIASEEIGSLQPEVREFEPRVALEAGDHGLSVLERMIPQAFHSLQSGGWFASEIALGQTESVCRLFSVAGFKGVGARRDLAGIDRMVIGRKSR